MFRIGYGEDIHRLVSDRPLILGGIVIPFEKGLLGHSDADVVCHALSDALLGALALGDIGTHFPDSDMQYKNANSVILLQKVATLVSEKNYLIVNIDIAISLEKPRLSPFIMAMRNKISETLGIELNTISIKAMTNEGLGSVGRGEACRATAIVLLKRK